MRKFSSTKRAKIMAIAAAGLIVGVGGSVTLAAWVDTEWVYGGNGNGGPGVGTSTFIVEQNRAAGATSAVGTWESEPDNPGGSLTFTGDLPLALTPGDTVVAPVALRTTPTPASIAGTVVYTVAQPADGVLFSDPDDLLWSTLELRIGRQIVPSGTAVSCTEGLAGYTIIADGIGLDTPFTDTSEAISAAGATYHHYCYEIYLPTVEELEEEYGEDFDVSTLMGRTVAPAWLFTSTSV